MAYSRRHFFADVFRTLLGALGLFGQSAKLLAASRQTVFGAATAEAVYAEWVGNLPVVDSDQIEVKLPEVAENGANVPMVVSSPLDRIESIAIIVENNPLPLSTELTLSSDTACYVAARIKMAQSSRVVVLAKRGDVFLRTQAYVRVVIGGCGSG